MIWKLTKLCKRRRGIGRSRTEMMDRTDIPAVRLEMSQLGRMIRSVPSSPQTSLPDTELQRGRSVSFRQGILRRVSGSRGGESLESIRYID